MSSLAVLKSCVKSARGAKLVHWCVLAPLLRLPWQARRRRVRHLALTTVDRLDTGARVRTAGGLEAGLHGRSWAQTLPPQAVLVEMLGCHMALKQDTAHVLEYCAEILAFRQDRLFHGSCLVVAPRMAAALWEGLQDVIGHSQSARPTVARHRASCGSLTTLIRHIIARTGRLPLDPPREAYSGVVGAVLSLARHQARGSRDISVWGWRDGRRQPGSVWNNVRLLPAGEWNWARFARWDLSWLGPMWLRGITSAHVEISHVHVDPNLLYVPGADTRILHLHTPIPDPLPRAYLRLLSRASAVICCSGFVRDRFLRLSGYAHERAYVVYNGADPEPFRDLDGRAQRAAWGYGDGDFLLVYSGAIVPEKGVEPLVHAFRILQSRIPNAALIIVAARAYGQDHGRTEHEWLTMRHPSGHLRRG